MQLQEQSSRLPTKGNRRRGVDLSVMGLAIALTEHWAENGEGLASLLWREAHELVGHMLDTWPRQGSWYHGRNDTPGDATTLLTLLSQLEDTAHIDAFLDILAASAYTKGDNAAIVQAAGLLPPERAASPRLIAVSMSTASICFAWSAVYASVIARRFSSGSGTSASVAGRRSAACACGLSDCGTGTILPTCAVPSGWI